MKNFGLTNFIIVLIFFAALIFVYIISGDIFDNKVNDSFIKIITKIQRRYADDSVVLVVFDNKSVKRMSWPWSRDNFSKIFDFIEHTSGAKAVVFKNLVVFPDTYNEESDQIFYNSLLNNDRLINSYVLLNSNISDDVVPAFYNSEFDLKSNVTITDKRKVKKDFSYNGIIKLPKEFLENSKYLASSALPLDNDDSVRSYMPVVMYNGKFYPSIALSAYSMYSGINHFVINDDGFLCSDDNCRSLKMPIEYSKVKDSSGNKTEALISYFDWYKPFNRNYSHKTYSAIDILDSIELINNNQPPLINPSEFNNKIVVIGLNASDSNWEQVHTTPILKNHSDIDIHAVMINNMLSNSFKSVNKKNFTSLITIFFCFLILRGFKNFKVNIAFTVLLSFLYFSFYLCEYIVGINTAPISPIITMYATAIFKTLYSAITTDKTAEMIKHAMGKYISKDVMKKVISNLDKLKLGGARTVATIFFVDIRNFTKISEELPPQEVTSILNEYFSTIEPVIAKYHGIVNKYVGDGLLAVFGEPVKTDEHALNAVLCGIEIIDKVRMLREKFTKENKPVINIGIGVNTGEVFAGNIGTEERFEYTVIGDNVNLASRIESYNQILKTQFLISEYTYEYVKDRIDVVKLSDVNIKGKSKPIDIYEVLRLKNETL